jgi:hypothetical protein
MPPIRRFQQFAIAIASLKVLFATPDACLNESANFSDSHATRVLNERVCRQRLVARLHVGTVLRRKAGIQELPLGKGFAFLWL